MGISVAYVGASRGFGDGGYECGDQSILGQVYGKLLDYKWVKCDIMKSTMAGSSGK